MWRFLFLSPGSWTEGIPDAQDAALTYSYCDPLPAKKVCVLWIGNFVTLEISTERMGSTKLSSGSLEIMIYVTFPFLPLVLRL